MNQTRKRIRIGSRVPEENREWLKSHGIVAEPPPRSRPVFFRSASAKSLLQDGFWPALLILFSFFIAVYQLVVSIQTRLNFETERRVSVESANLHLRAQIAQLRLNNQTQQAEIVKMTKQIQDLSIGFRSQIENLQKNAAMSEDLNWVYEGALMVLTAKHHEQGAFSLSQFTEKNEDLSVKGQVVPNAPEVLVIAPGAKRS